MKRPLGYVVLPSAFGAAALTILLATAWGEPAEQVQPAALVRGQVAVRVRLGLKDTEPTDWSGSAKPSAGQIAGIAGWQLTQGDYARGQAWQANTRRYQPRPGQDPNKMPMGDVGVVLRLDGTAPDTRLEITTKQGNFSFALSDLAAGQPLSLLDGAVEAARIASSQDLVVTPDEEDFPAAATAADGTVCVAYLAFTPGPHFAARPPLKEDPKDYAMFAEATGGDRIWLTTLKASQWSKPIAVTDGGEDLYRPAIAVDGQQRVWIFYSKNVNAGTDLTGGDWELFVRSYRDGKLGPAIQLTQDAGPDVCPAATTDAEGRVWVTWQAFRDGNARILAAKQEGEGFGKPFVVADTSANEWSPAIAATTTKPAEVTIAWDTYAKGDYDVYARTYRNGVAGEPFAVAATLNYEARPAVAYDGGRRLWVAWEQSGEKWGKNYGPEAPEAKMGIPLYLDRKVMVRVLDAGKWFEPAGDLNSLWPKKPALGKRGKKQQAERASYVRLGTDRSGRVWLSARVWMAPPILQNQIWHEYVTYAGADGWTRPLFTAGPVRMLDKRPALVSDPEGGLLLIGAGSGRQSPTVATKRWKDMTPEERRGGEQVNNNLYVTPLAVAAAAGQPKLQPVEALVVAQAPRDPEPDDIRRVQAYRVESGGKTLRVVRGEFHRHTEFSADGGGDGSLEDMWRYALDAAAMDWLGNGDHDNGSREFPWWLTQKTSAIYQLPGRFTPMYTYERSVNYPDGHRNAVFAQRGVRPLPRLQDGTGKILDDTPAESRPQTPDTQMFYHYLLQFKGICASHTSATDMGTDWRDNHRQAEPIVEIYQGDRQNYECIDAPRAPTDKNALGGWRPQGFINLALGRGYRLGFECSSDHISTHISYCNVLVERLTREEILRGMQARHVYGSTDNIVADARWTAGGEEHLMGDEFAGTKPPMVRVHLEGTGPFAKVSIIRNNRHVHTLAPKRPVVDFTWTDFEPQSGTSYYYVRGEQEDGELVWLSPVWINYTGKTK